MTIAVHPKHLQHVHWAPHPRRPPDLTAWPFTIPAVAQLIRQGGLEIPPGVTFLVGENGSGKSTLLEAMAEIYPRRGHETRFAAVTGPDRSCNSSPTASPSSQYYGTGSTSWASTFWTSPKPPSPSTRACRCFHCSTPCAEKEPKLS
jgi:hypothetical protein